MKLVIASNNAHKIEEFRTALKGLNAEVLSLKDMNINVDPDETGSTFKENAFIKASEISKFTNEIIIADDSGLEVEALDGFPGIYSSRFLENSTYEEKFVALNKMLEGKENRNANFTCALCILNLEKEPIYIESKVFGTLLDSIGDITSALNHALSVLNAKKKITDENAKSFIGSGAKMLIKRTMDYVGLSEEYVEEFSKTYFEYYSKNMNIKTKPYPYVMEVLQKLNDSNIK